MNITQCENGHYFDSDRTTMCPYCNSQQPNYAEAVIGKTALVKTSDKEEGPYVFISYAHLDSEEVLNVLSFLKENHFNIWYDEGIKSGYEWADEISRKIKRCKQFICFMSKNSIMSESVKDEIHIAWKYNINTIVVYLEKLELDGGLEMKLDRKQAILKYKMTEQEFQRKLSSSITQDAVNINNNEEPDDFRLIDKYEIIKSMSKGGTASTYLAKNKSTGMYVVLKHGKYDETVSGQRIKKSFERERETLSKNISPFVPSIYDYFYDSQNIYLAETYIEGCSINNIVGMSLCDKIEKFIQAAKVIKTLHKRGIYHCDIKPEHIIVNHHGCFLIDFGSAENVGVSAKDDVKMGTVTYAAPEQFVSYNGENDLFGNYEAIADNLNEEQTIDERTDIYAFGRTMIKVLSGNLVSDVGVDFGVPDETVFLEVTAALFSNVAKTIGDFSDNPLLQAIIEKMVRDKKSERYINMDDVITVLEDFLKIYR